jgi:hypothetical protein
VGSGVGNAVENGGVPFIFSKADNKILVAFEYQGDLMKALLIVGCMFIGFGVISLAYFGSPIRILLQASLGQQRLHLLIPSIGGAAILIGIAILFVTRSTGLKDKK